MSDTKKTILAFCANEQLDTEHSVDINGTGEIVLTCGGHESNTRILITKNEDGTETKSDEIIPCGRSLKFAKGTTAEELKVFLVKHKEANEGQITVEALETEKEKLLAGLL